MRQRNQTPTTTVFGMDARYALSRRRTVRFFNLWIQLVLATSGLRPLVRSGTPELLYAADRFDCTGHRGLCSAGERFRVVSSLSDIMLQQ